MKAHRAMLTKLPKDRCDVDYIRRLMALANRLPSTVCPMCGSKLLQEDGRVMICVNCGFKAPRDMVPMYWAVKFYI